MLASLQIYHPNVDLEGNVCLNILREDWKPVLNLNSVMVGLQYLFLEPNADDPLNKGAFTQMHTIDMLRVLLPIADVSNLTPDNGIDDHRGSRGPAQGPISVCQQRQTQPWRRSNQYVQILRA